MVHACQKGDQGGLPAAGRAYEGEHFSGLRRQADLMEHRLVFLVGKRHLIEFHTAHDLGPTVCARPLQLVVALHELEHPIAGNHTHLKRIKAVCKLPKRTVQHVDEQGQGG